MLLEEPSPLLWWERQGSLRLCLASIFFQNLTLKANQTLTWRVLELNELATWSSAIWLQTPGLMCKSIATCCLRTLLFICRQRVSRCPTWSELPANLKVITMGVSQGRRAGLFGYEFLSWWPWKICFLPIPVSMLDTYVRVRVPGCALWGRQI